MQESGVSTDDLIIHDGRQSETAAAVQRGTGRMLREAGMAFVPELPLVTGRRVDLIAVDREILPDDTGLIVADAYGAEILRSAPKRDWLSSSPTISLARS